MTRFFTCRAYRELFCDGRKLCGGFAARSLRCPACGGGKTAPLGDEEPIRDDAESGVMVKSEPASPFEMAQPQFLFQLLVIALNDPAVFGKVDEVSQRQVCGKTREPVFCGLTLTFRPFDQKPFLRMRFCAPVIAMCRAHTNCG